MCEVEVDVRVRGSREEVVKSRLNFLVDGSCEGGCEEDEQKVEMWRKLVII